MRLIQNKKPSSTPHSLITAAWRDAQGGPLELHEPGFRAEADRRRIKERV